MKKILMLCLALVMGVGMCVAAEKQTGTEKKVTTVFVTDIDCEHCVKKIMNNVPSLGKGIKDVKVDLPKKEVTVIYDGSKNSDENIVKGFATIKVKAEPKRPLRRSSFGGFVIGNGETSSGGLPVFQFREEAMWRWIIRSARSSTRKASAMQTHIATSDLSSSGSARRGSSMCGSPMCGSSGREGRSRGFAA